MHRSNILILNYTLAFAIIFIISSLNHTPASATLEIFQPETEPGYTLYTNDRVGVSFEYPSSWTLEEKQNRFDTGPDALVSDGLQMFKILFREDSMKDLIGSLGFEATAKILKNEIAKNSNLIEDIDFNRYKIDGKETATFLELRAIETGEELPSQAFIVNDGGSLVTFGYQDTKTQFDTPESQNIMNHILNSIKFLV